jgi:hypothetical protein
LSSIAIFQCSIAVSYLEPESFEGLHSTNLGYKKMIYTILHSIDLSCVDRKLEKAISKLAMAAAYIRPPDKNILISP